MSEGNREDARGQRIEPRRVLQDGLFAGLLGGLGVMGVFLIHDLLQGELLHTPSTLGTLLFHGAEAARNADPELTRAISYNAIHIPLWLLAGVLGAYAMALVEHHPKVWYLVFVAVAFVFAGFLYLEGAFRVPGLGRLQLWAGALVGAAAMVAFLWWTHPATFRHLDDIYRDQKPDPSTLER